MSGSAIANPLSIHSGSAFCSVMLASSFLPLFSRHHTPTPSPRVGVTNGSAEREPPPPTLVDPLDAPRIRPSLRVPFAQERGDGTVGPKNPHYSQTHV